MNTHVDSNLQCKLLFSLDVINIKHTHTKLFSKSQKGSVCHVILIAVNQPKPPSHSQWLQNSLPYHRGEVLTWWPRLRLICCSPPISSWRLSCCPNFLFYFVNSPICDWKNYIRYGSNMRNEKFFFNLW